MQSHLIADSFVSLAAFLGLLILRVTLKHSEASTPLNDRFLFAIKVVSAIILSRVLWWLTDIRLFDVITIIAAGLVPLATLILCEGLLLRHAPKIMKWLAAGGAVLFLVLAFFPPSLVDPARVIALLVFQSTMFLAVGYLVLSRDKDSLSVAENSTVERLGLSLLLILPFVVSDYRSDFLDVPVRMSGIAILFMCWLAISIGRGNLSHREISRSFFMMAFSAIAAGAAISWLADFDMRTTVQCTAIIVSATVLASIYNEGKTTQRDEERDSLLRYVAEVKTEEPEVFLRGLQNHSLVEGALILNTKDLTDFDETFPDCFTTNPIRKLSEMGKENSQSHDEQLSWFFEKYDATHAMLAAREPFTVVALNMPTLAVSPGADVELQAVQRMAYLLSTRKAT